MHHFLFAYRPRLTSTMPWQSMFWVGKRANRTQLQGIYSCWEHSSVQCPIVSSTIHIKKRCCPTLFSDQFAMSYCSNKPSTPSRGWGHKGMCKFCWTWRQDKFCSVNGTFQLGGFHMMCSVTYCTDHAVHTVNWEVCVWSSIWRMLALW